MLLVLVVLLVVVVVVVVVAIIISITHTYYEHIIIIVVVVIVIVTIFRRPCVVHGDLKPSDVIYMGIRLYVHQLYFQKETLVPFNTIPCQRGEIIVVVFNSRVVLKL